MTGSPEILWQLFGGLEKLVGKGTKSAQAL
jgi:hypothetical protein